jgi:hypothetical protein
VTPRRDVRDRAVGGSLPDSRTAQPKSEWHRLGLGFTANLSEFGLGEEADDLCRNPMGSCWNGIKDDDPIGIRHRPTSWRFVQADEGRNKGHRRIGKNVNLNGTMRIGVWESRRRRPKPDVELVFADRQVSWCGHDFRASEVNDTRLGVESHAHCSDCVETQGHAWRGNREEARSVSLDDLPGRRNQYSCDRLP